MNINENRYAAIAKQAAEIREKNAQYEKATAAERRVLIAEDALGMLLIGTYLAKEGEYASVKPKREQTITLGTSVGSLLRAAPEDMPQCRVCAIGSVMLSTFRLKNDFTLANLGGALTDAELEDTKARDNPELSYARIRSLFAEGRTEALLTPDQEKGSYYDGYLSKLSLRYADRAYFTEAFSNEMLREMERDFEHYWCTETSDIRDVNIRLFAILTNVVENHGAYPIQDHGGDATNRERVSCSHHRHFYARALEREQDWFKRFQDARAAALLAVGVSNPEPYVPAWIEYEMPTGVYDDELAPRPEEDEPEDEEEVTDGVID